LRWPAEASSVDAASSNGTPVLLVVATGTAPPLTTDCCRDWIWEDATDHEKRLRLRQLALRSVAHGRALPRIDDLGILHFGLRSIPLPPKERLLLEPLLERFGKRVPAADVVRAAWGDLAVHPQVVRSRVAALRRRIRGAGLLIDSRGAHFAVRAAAENGFDPTGPGFDEEM
jgi:hypothetical protein